MGSLRSWWLVVGGSWRDGWRRVWHGPAIAAGVFALTMLLALPLALTMRGLIETHLGTSTAAASAADSVNYDWWQEFTSQAAGLGATFTPAIVGFAATLDNISSIVDGPVEIVPIAAAVAVYLLGWTFAAGAIVDRYARQRKTRAHGFFAAGGVNMFRLLRLAAIAGIAYWLLFRYVHASLFTKGYDEWVRHLDTERQAAALRAALYLVFGVLLLAVNIVVDYARIRIVVEDRRSVIGALLAALRFVVRNPASAGLYAVNAGVFVLLIAVWSVVAPGAGGGGVSIWLTFLLAQAYVLARLLLKLHFLASQTALFQSRLAHAAYTAAPEARWPDSPAAETLTATPRRPGSA
jgi:hypothetical protein